MRRPGRAARRAGRARPPAEVQHAGASVQRLGEAGKLQTVAAAAAAADMRRPRPALTAPTAAYSFPLLAGSQVENANSSKPKVTIADLIERANGDQRRRPATGPPASACRDSLRCCSALLPCLTLIPPAQRRAASCLAGWLAGWRPAAPPTDSSLALPATPHPFSDAWQPRCRSRRARVPPHPHLAPLHRGVLPPGHRPHRAAVPPAQGLREAGRERGSGGDALRAPRDAAPGGWVGGWARAGRGCPRRRWPCQCLGAGRPG